jgi:hypothetical protein
MAIMMLGMLTAADVIIRHDVAFSPSSHFLDESLVVSKRYCCQMQADPILFVPGAEAHPIIITAQHHACMQQW